MNAVYCLCGPKNDFEAGFVDPLGLLRMPSLNCPACGCYGGRPEVWYASLKPVTPEAQALCQEPLPETAGSPEEFAAVREKVRFAFQTDVPLWPGYLIGVQPITVKGKGLIGGLTTKKLKQGIDVIQAASSYILSHRFVGVMEALGVEPPTGPVKFSAGTTVFEGYRVLELQPRATWIDTCRSKYGIEECKVCGSCLKKVLGGTFAMKEYRGDIFGHGSAVVRSSEENAVLVNQQVHDEMSRHALTGFSLRKVGVWV